MSQRGNVDKQQKDRGFIVKSNRDWWGTDEDKRLHLVLDQPRIPGNTGNIGRMCAGADIWLHLVRPLGYELDNKHLRRAGLDYWPSVDLSVHDSFDELEDLFSGANMYLYSKTGCRRYTEPDFGLGDVLVFGSETGGLDRDLLSSYDDAVLRIPNTDDVRSLNLSNACAVATYEALRQMNWPGIL